MGWADSADIRARQATLEALFFDSMREIDQEGIVAAVATMTSTTKESIRLVWNDLIGGMREWIGDRQLKDLQGRMIVLTPRHWERTVEILKDHLDDDGLGLAKESMNGLLIIVQADYAIKVAEKLVAGFTDLGWDGKAIFAADHPIEVDGVATTLDNLSDVAVSAAGITEMRLYFRNLRAPDGTRLRVKPDTIVAGPSSEVALEALFDSDRLASGASNPNYKRFNYQIIPEIDDTTWMALCTTGPVKPIRLVTRQTGQLLWNYPYMRNVAQAGVDARHDAIWTSYQFAWGSTGDA